MASKPFQNSFPIANHSGSNGSSSGPCKCCPYGFHIDTDFVRYCDALLTALYGNNRSLTNTTCRSFGSLRRKLNLALTSPELFPSTTPKSFFSFCDFNVKNSQSYQLAHNCFDNNNDDGSFCTQEHLPARRPHRNLAENHFTSSSSIETASSATAYEAESMLTEAVSKFEEVLLESKSSSKLNIYTSNANNIGVHESPPPSPTPSSCPSSSISKSVLTQIRNHLALSLTRVKELENQVSQIPFLKEQIFELQTQRNELLAKLSGQQKRGQYDRTEQDKLDVLDSQDIDASSQCVMQRLPLNCTDNGVGLQSETPTQGSAGSVPTEHLISRLSITKCESISIVGDLFPSHSNEKTTRSIGTLTSFAPSLPPKNAFVQTDLKGKNLLTKVNTVCTGTLTDFIRTQVASSQTFVQMQHVSTNTTDLPSYADLQVISDVSQDLQSVNEVSVELPKVMFDKSISTSELSTSVARPISLDIMTDSSINWLSSLNYSSPSSSSHSIRLCDKCHEMINSITFDNLCSQDIAVLSLPKIIKSDSGISVERRQVDNKASEECENHVSTYPELEMSSSIYTQSSEDQDQSEKRKPKAEKKPIDYHSVQPSNETKAALNVINENLLEPKKSNSFLFVSLT